MTAAVPQRVVIPIIAGLGNSLMAMPMVRQIKQTWPGCRITILARSGAMGEPFKRMPEVEEVLITGVGLKALRNAIKFSRSRKPDIYLIPFPSNRWHYSVLALTSGAKKRVLHSYPAGKWRALHFIGTRMPAEQRVHDVVQNLRLLKLIGITPDESESPRFVVTNADRAKANELLAKAGLLTPSPGTPGEGWGEGEEKDGANSAASSFILHPSSFASDPLPEYRERGPEGFIAVHAGSGSYTVIARAKRWPPARYAELIDRMRSETGKPILLMEGPDESGVAESILKELPEPDRRVHVLKLAGPLGEAAAVLERASLYVGSDSGLAHLAASVGKRAVTIFAPADPDRVCPHGSRDLVVQTPTSCSPCFTYPFKTPYTDSMCREPYCIEQVTVDRVAEAVRRALGIVPLTIKGIA
jgi:heptosyltransferase-2